jgi:hypothetical protein
MSEYDYKWQDYYKILGLYDENEEVGIGPNVTSKRLREAWEFEKIKWHPDNFQSGSSEWHKAHEKFLLINEAYEILSDPAKKEQYDHVWKRIHGWHERRVHQSITIDNQDSTEKGNLKQYISNNSPFLGNLQSKFFDSLFIWWWVPALGVNFIGGVLLPSLLGGILGVSYEKIVEGFMNGCKDTLGLLCPLLLLAVIWWVILIFLIILLIIFLLILLLNYVWPIISPIFSTYISFSILTELRPLNAKPFSKNRWKQILAATLSLPLSYLVFVFLLKAPTSPITYEGVQVSGGGPWIGRISILPRTFENLWFFLFGLVAFVITFIVITLYSNYQERTNKIRAPIKTN